MFCARWLRVLRGLAIALPLLSLSGCLTSSGSFAIFPSGEYLLRSTKELSRNVPPGAVVPRELDKTVLSAYIVQPGDVLLVEPVELDSPLRLPADQTVLADGTIDLGRFGRVIVAGRTLEQIESEVTAAVAAEKDAGQINVRLVNPQSAVFYVLGEVSSPGSFPYVGSETVLDAILSAGGLTDRASPCNIILSRPSTPCGCRTVVPICYRDIVQKGDTTTNYQVMPGDRIFVASRTLWESLFPIYNRHDCPNCRGKQCACPGACGAATAHSTSYSLPGAIGPDVIAPDAIMHGAIGSSVEVLPPATLDPFEDGMPSAVEAGRASD